MNEMMAPPPLVSRLSSLLCDEYSNPLPCTERSESAGRYGLPDMDVGYVVTRFARCMCTTLFLDRSRQQYVWSCLREKTSELLERKPLRPWRPWHGSSASRASRDRHPPLSLLPHERLIFGTESVPDLNSILHLAKSRREECSFSFLSFLHLLLTPNHRHRDG